ncbi:MAG: M6 family metalloprotease domain-containing protein [Bacteroidaceae bacterium]|nr:M6 family metalloprotease domain-containing protein [Bacteroidaceae bacterium]
MKRALCLFLIYWATVGMHAIPAMPEIWRTLRLKDGTEVRAQLKGDEFCHYWRTDDGRNYVKSGEEYVEANEITMSNRAQSLRTTRQASAMSRRVAIGERTHYTGKKKGLVILAEFKDVKFNASNNKAKYEKILNAEGYTTSEGFKGSVADYFKAQSGGEFELEFDVFGPVQLANNQSYYGENDANGSDKRAVNMIVEACKAVDSQVNFREYDWDDDYEVDEVYVVYAGKGEATSGNDDTIWPHMFYLKVANINLFLDKVRINTYACSNELTSSGKIEGIGGICHEFSHCLGYPDLYDTANGVVGSLQSYDIMDSGGFNGSGFVPAGFSAYEKWMAGWIDLTVLSNQNVTVSNLKPVSEGGGGYIIYNDGHPDEYYILENRQQTNWDKYLPGRGLMITHVDYDAQLWYLNIPNSVLTSTSNYVRNYGYPTNDHARLIIFRADNNASSSYTSMSHDLYPYQANDSLTATSKPAAIYYNPNMLDEKFLQGGILNITQNSDRTMNFFYRASDEDTGISEVHPDSERTPSVIYDLQGRRFMGGHLPKGIYIENGKVKVRG